MSGFRTTLLLALTIMCLSAHSARSYSATLDAKLTFANLPTTITLCRDSAAVASNNGWDEQWAILIDIDGNALTGAPGSGAEVALIAQTIPQSNPCSSSVVNTVDAVLSATLTWNGSTFAQTAEVPNLTFDFAAHTMTLSSNTSGVLSGLSAASKLSAQALASYKPTGSPPTVASNAVPYTVLGTPITDPSGNVQGCSSPCSAAAPYYSIVDIVGFDPASATTSDANTLTFEFHVASLTANIGLCLFPGAFASDGPGIDLLWLSAIDIDHDGTFDVGVVAHTTPQDQNCSTHTEAIATAVTAELDTIESGGLLVHGSDVPVTVDTTTGIITVKAPLNDPLLAGLSSSSVLAEQTQGYYAANHMIAVDLSTAFTLGASFSDPIQDVTQCSGNCSTGQPWYPSIDLVGGTVYGPNIIFRNGFE